MKKFSILTTTALLITPLAAELESEIPLGLEAVTGIRSEYVHRGFKLSQQMVDFQLEGEISLADDQFFGYGAWYATGTGANDFSETGVKFSYTREYDTLQWHNSLFYRDQHNSPQDSGIEALTRLSFFLTESSSSSQEISVILSYDTGADGIYGAVDYESYTALNDDCYFTFRSGVSCTSDYYDRSGANDWYSFLSCTYNLTKQISLTPFVATSVQLDGANGSDYAYGGVWFEVSF